MTRAITGASTQVYIAKPLGDLFDGFVMVDEVSQCLLIRGWDALEVTNFDSPQDKEHIKGLRNPGRYTLRGNWISDAPGQNELRTAFDDQRPWRFLIILPPSPGSTGAESWSFSGLVLSCDPVRITPAAKLEFESLVQATGPRSFLPRFANATGQVTFVISRPLGINFQATMWSNFVVSSIVPPNAVIVGIYPVLICSAVLDAAFQYFDYGPSMDLTSVVAGTGFILPFDPSTSSFGSTEFYGDSIGTSLNDLTDQCIRILLNVSEFLDNLTANITATAVGFAVIYTSDAAIVDPQMPAPFALEPGQGLAWALPFAVTETAPNGQGTAVGTAAQ